MGRQAGYRKEFQSSQCFHVLQAPCCGKLYVCRLCHDAEENHEMDRFKVREVQCAECQTVQQVSEGYLPAVAGPTIPLMLQVLVMYLCSYWCLLLFKGTTDLWAVPCTVWRVLLWHLPLVWQGQKAVPLSTLWNMQVSNGFTCRKTFLTILLLRLGREGFHSQPFRMLGMFSSISS